MNRDFGVEDSGLTKRSMLNSEYDSRIEEITMTQVGRMHCIVVVQVTAARTTSLRTY